MVCICYGMAPGEHSPICPSHPDRAPGGPPSRPCTCGSKDDTHPLTCAKVAWLNTPPTGPFPAPPSRPPIPESANPPSKAHSAAECPYGVEAHGFMGEHGRNPESECSGLPPPPPRCTNEFHFNPTHGVVRCELPVWHSGPCSWEAVRLAFIGAIAEAKAEGAAELARKGSRRPPEVESPSVSLAFNETCAGSWNVAASRTEQSAPAAGDPEAVSASVSLAALLRRAVVDAEEKGIHSDITCGELCWWREARAALGEAAGAERGGEER